MGVSAIASKILCGRHNSLLEKVDRAGIAAIAAIDESIDPRQDTVAQTDGFDLERWLLKITINLTIRGKERVGVGMNEAGPGLPAPYLLDVVFGDISLSHKMGLYVIFPEGEYKFRMGEIIVVPIKKDGEIGGVYFNLRGVHVVLSLFPSHAPPALAQLGQFGLPENIVKPTPQYRPSSIKIPRRDGTVSEIKFRWMS